MKLIKSIKPSKAIKIEITQRGRKVGRAYLYLIKNDLSKKPYGLMEDVFVDERYRGQGLGTKLIKKVIEEAKRQKCYKLIATSRISKPGLHTFYQGFGFKKWGVEFRMDFQ